MKIDKIKISNVLGVEQMEVKAGKINEISGKNGEGKTSIIESIKFALQGGSDATLLRNGAEKSEVVLVFDNGMTVEKSQTPIKATLKVKDKRGKDIQKPQGYLSKIFDMISVNPVSFLLAKPEERTKVLLKTLNIEVSNDELANELQQSSLELLAEYDVDAIADGLKKLEKARSTLFSERTAVNREIKSKKNAIEETEKALQPFETSEKDFEDVLAEKKKAAEELAQARLDFLEELNQKYAQEKEKLNEKFNKENAVLQAEIGEAERIIKEKTHFIEVNSFLEKSKQELESLNEEANLLSYDIATLDNIKANKLQDLPIENVDIIDGQLYVNSVQFDRLNTAEQIKVAIEIAKLKAGNSGVICVDGLERFDTNTYNQFKEQIQATDLQVFITKVSDDNLQVIAN